jgi:hypothetical protein
MKHAKMIIILVLIAAAFVAAVGVSRARIATRTSVQSGPSGKLEAIAERFDVELTEFKELGGGDIEFSLRTSPPNRKQIDATIAAAMAEGALTFNEEVGVASGSGFLQRGYEMRYYRGHVKQ